MGRSNSVILDSEDYTIADKTVIEVLKDIRTDLDSMCTAMLGSCMCGSREATTALGLEATLRDLIAVMENREKDIGTQSLSSIKENGAVMEEAACEMEQNNIDISEMKNLRGAS